MIACSEETADNIGLEHYVVMRAAYKDNGNLMIGGQKLMVNIHLEVRCMQGGGHNFKPIIIMYTLNIIIFNINV